MVGGGECRDLHNVSHASGACGCNGVVLQLHHVFKIVRQQEQRLGTFEGRAQRLWLAQIPSDPCDTWHLLSLLQVASKRARAGTPAWESRRSASLPIKPVLPVTRIMCKPPDLVQKAEGERV